jgi:hypothetical protein
MSSLDKYVLQPDFRIKIQPCERLKYQTDCFLFFRSIAQLRACRPIPEDDVRELCFKARELLIEEGNVVNVDAPVTVRLLLGSLSILYH